MKKFRLVTSECKDINKNANGGDYDEWNIYEEVEPGKFQVSYHTSSDMAYCPACGQYGHEMGDQEGTYDDGTPHYRECEFKKINASEIPKEAKIE